MKTNRFEKNIKDLMDAPNNWQILLLSIRFEITLKYFLSVITYQLSAFANMEFSWYPQQNVSIPILKTLSEKTDRF